MHGTLPPDPSISAAPRRKGVLVQPLESYAGGNRITPRRQRAMALLKRMMMNSRRMLMKMGMGMRRIEEWKLPPQDGLWETG